MYCDDKRRIIMRKQDSIGLTGAGKGDKDRSPGWRKHYDEIQWTPKEPDRPKKFRKVYGK